MSRMFRLTVTGIVALLRKDDEHNGPRYTVVVPNTLLGSEVGQSKPNKKDALDGKELKRHSPQLILGGTLPGLLLRGHRIEFPGLLQTPPLIVAGSMDLVPKMQTLAGGKRGGFDSTLLNNASHKKGLLSAILEIKSGTIRAAGSDGKWKIEALPETDGESGQEVEGQLATSVIWEVPIPEDASIQIQLTHLATATQMSPIDLPSTETDVQLTLANVCTDSHCGPDPDTDDDFRWYYSFLEEGVRKKVTKYYEENDREKLPVPTLVKTPKPTATIEGQNCRPCEYAL